MLGRLMRVRRICPECARLRSSSDFVRAYNVISTMPKTMRQMLIAAGRDYESWLNTGAMEVVGDARKLEKTPRAVKKYRYL